MGGEDGCDGSWGIYFLYRTQMICNTKDQQPWNNTKQIFPEQKTKKSFALGHLCPVHELWVEFWNPLLSGQIINSFGQGKCTFDCQSGNFKNYSFGNHVSARSCMLRTEKLINFNMTWMWTFHTNSLNAKKSLQILDFQRLASLDYVLQQVQTLSLL